MRTAQKELGSSPGAARSSPGTARSSQEQPGAARKQPGPSQKAQEQRRSSAGAAQEQPGAAQEQRRSSTGAAQEQRRSSSRPRLLEPLLIAASEFIRLLWRFIQLGFIPRGFILNRGLSEDKATG